MSTAKLLDREDCSVTRPASLPGHFDDPQASETSGGHGHDDVAAVHSSPHKLATGGRPVRLTVNLTSQAAAALNRASDTTRHSKTDTVNRALQIYDLVLELVERGEGSLTVVHPGGEIEQIQFL
ncbi:hypothetical protein [Catenuloplanes japonicus]|uniref:hypothetical protein n=1 Tax=Catenuloplanes japonicus TaxID=33876 RepID=UPI0012FA53CF|nr:hypothetical protein [Catenuloplanes japonicus]